MPVLCRLLAVAGDFGFYMSVAVAHSSSCTHYIPASLTVEILNILILVMCPCFTPFMQVAVVLNVEVY